METENSSDLENLTNFDNITELHNEIADMCNHASKYFSEMNNTLNWATTIVIALYIFCSKLDLTIELNKILFNINNFAFIALIVVFVLFKLKNIRMEDETTTMLDSMVSSRNTLKRLSSKTFKNSSQMEAGLLKVKSMNVGIPEKRYQKINEIGKQLNLYFKIAMFLFVVNATMMPIYYLVQMFL